MDVLMPQVNGWEACRILKADPKTRAIPIIVVTALSQIKDTDKAFESGANDYLAKPFEYDRLFYKIHKFIA
jgi:CheY-like chemotaxis protein